MANEMAEMRPFKRSEINDHIVAFTLLLQNMINITQPPLIAVAAAVSALADVAPEFRQYLELYLSGKTTDEVAEQLSVSVPKGSHVAKGANA